jgi:hypothetical protein
LFGQTSDENFGLVKKESFEGKEEMLCVTKDI